MSPAEITRLDRSIKTWTVFAILAGNAATIAVGAFWIVLIVT